MTMSVLKDTNFLPYSRDMEKEGTFTPLSFSEQCWLSFQVNKRQIKVATTEALKWNQVFSISSAAIAVFGIGTLEGFMLSSKAPRARGTWKFCMRYGLSQVLPSVIWTTKPAEVVVRSMGKNPDLFLRKFDLNHLTDAKYFLRITTAQNLRSIIAGFVGIAQILCLCNSAATASDTFTNNVEKGREPVLSGIEHRIIRLAGKVSDVTSISLLKDGLHLVPIIEEPSNPFAEELRRIMTNAMNSLYPVYWHVKEGEYGKKESWNGFHIERKWFMKTKDNRRILIVEGDSSVGEQALALGESSCTDLDLQETSQAFRMIKKLSIESQAILPIHEDVIPKETIYDGEIIRVLLADSSQTIITGGNKKYTVLEHLYKYNEADILIDAKKPLIESITHWACEALTLLQHSIPSAKPIIVFNTNNQEYFKTIKIVLEGKGWTVLDQSCRGEDTFLELVYQNSTSDTVNTIESLLSEQLVEAQFCCALLDQQEGLKELEDLNEMMGCKVANVCSALLYDKLFRYVRHRLLEGDSFSKIQSELQRLDNGDKKCELFHLLSLP